MLSKIVHPSEYNYLKTVVFKITLKSKIFGI